MTDNTNKTTALTEYMAAATPILQLMSNLVTSNKPETVASALMMEGAKLLRKVFKTDAYFTLLDSIFDECRKLKAAEDQLDKE